MYKSHFPTHAKCFVQGTHRIALIYKTLNISLMPAAASLFHVFTHCTHTNACTHSVTVALSCVEKGNCRGQLLRTEADMSF